MTPDSTSAPPSGSQRIIVAVGYPTLWWRGEVAWVVLMAAAVLVVPGPEEPGVDAAVLISAILISEGVRRIPFNPRIFGVVMAGLPQIFVTIFLFVDPALETPAALASLVTIVASAAFTGVGSSLGGAGVASVGFTAAIAVGDASPVVVIPIMVMNWIAGPIVGRLFDSYRQVVDEAADAAEDRRQTLEDLRAATRLERRLLADRLHDRPVQSLITALFLVDRNPDRARVFIEQALAEIRNEIWTANPVVEAPDSEALAVVTMERLAGGGVRGELEVSAWGEVPPSLRPLIWRTIGEAITNVLKHGRATETSVRLSVDGAWVEVEVANDDSQEVEEGMGGGESGYGLRSLVQEWEHFGGSLAGGSRPGGGFLLRGWAPFSHEAGMPPPR